MRYLVLVLIILCSCVNGYCFDSDEYYIKSDYTIIYGSFDTKHDDYNIYQLEDEQLLFIVRFDVPTIYRYALIKHYVELFYGLDRGEEVVAIAIKGVEIAIMTININQEVR